MSILNHRPGHNSSSAVRRAWTTCTKSGRVESKRCRRRREETKERIFQLPAELQSAILSEWILDHPPTVAEKDGILHHPLIEDDWVKLHRHAFHDLFHASPLHITQKFDCCIDPSEVFPVSWLESTPQFLRLHDLYCGEAARHNLKFAIRVQVRAHMSCAHRSFTFPGAPEHLRVDRACSCQYYSYAKGLWKNWCADFMDREGIPCDNARFEVVFIPDTTFKRKMRWAKKHPISACGKAVTYAFFGMIFPIVIAGTLVYVTPIWALFLSRKLHDLVWPKVVTAARKLEKEWQKKALRATRKLSNQQLHEKFKVYTRH